MTRTLTLCFALAAVSLFVGSSPARAAVYTLTLDRMLPAPDDNTFAIAWGDDGTLWTHGQTTKTFYRLDPATGAILTSFPSNDQTLLGFDVRGGILFGLEEPAIVRYDEATGIQLSSLTGPVTGGARGLTSVGSLQYVAGVLNGFPGQVRLGRIDPATGALLTSNLPPLLVDTNWIGRIGVHVAYVIHQGGGQQTLRIVDPSSGSLVEDVPLFTGGDVYYGLDASSSELFVTRRDLQQIWVYRLGQPTPVKSKTWGAIKALYR